MWETLQVILLNWCNFGLWVCHTSTSIVTFGSVLHGGLWAQLIEIDSDVKKIDYPFKSEEDNQELEFLNEACDRRDRVGTKSCMALGHRIVPRISSPNLWLCSIASPIFVLLLNTQLLDICFNAPIMAFWRGKQSRTQVGFIFDSWRTKGSSRDSRRKRIKIQHDSNTEESTFITDCFHLNIYKLTIYEFFIKWDSAKR